MFRREMGSKRGRLDMYATLVRDYEYFIPTKFHQNPSWHQAVLEKKLKMWKFTDRQRDDGRCAMTIAHLSLWLRWAKKPKKCHMVSLLVCQQLSDRNRTFLRIFQSVLTTKFWHRHFQKGYLKSISKVLEKFVKFERKIEIIPLENIEKITQFSGSGTTIIGHQGIRAS